MTPPVYLSEFHVSKSNLICLAVAYLQKEVQNVIKSK